MKRQSAKKKFIIPDGKDIKLLRQGLGLTQKQVAELTGLSQSLIARIENESVNPRVSTLKSILAVLYSTNDSNNPKEIESIMSQNVIYANEDSSISSTIDLMNKNNVSQLPVKDSKDNIVGSITEKQMMNYLTINGRKALTQTIKDILEPKFPEVPISISLSQLNKILTQRSAVLVLVDKKIRGIITKSDLLRYYKS